jgi:glutathione peroxidase-family protein
LTILLKAAAAYNVRFGVRRADVLGRNIVPIFPPERQAAGTLNAMTFVRTTFEKFLLKNNFLIFLEKLK